MVEKLYKTVTQVDKNTAINAIQNFYEFCHTKNKEISKSPDIFFVEGPDDLLCCLRES
jgi:hypothetical protein